MTNIYKYLDDLDIKYIKYDHVAVFTVDEALAVGQDGPGHTKNLFLRNKKGDKHYLVVIDHNKKVDLKELAKLLDISRLSFASPERLKGYLGLEPGSVTLLALINDPDHKVQVVIDKELWQEEVIYCHPLVNTATLELRRGDLEKFIASTDHSIKFLDL